MTEGIKKLGPIDISAKPIYDDYLKRYPTELSDQTFTNLFIWRKIHPANMIESANSLIVYEEREEGIILYGMPLGPTSLESAVNIVQKHTSKEILVCDYISERTVSESLPKKWEVVENRNHFDYIYAQRDLTNLEGRRYSKKRNLISQCLTSNKCAYETIDDKNIEEVSDMMDRWCDYRSCKDDRGLCNEFRATRELFQNYNDLDVMGATVRVKGQIEAFTIAQPLNDRTVVIHLEKAMPDIKGLYQLINHWFCKNQLQAFERVNRESDLGIAGLRRAKESYYPESMVKKFLVYPYGKERAKFADPPEFKRCLDEEG